MKKAFYFSLVAATLSSGYFFLKPSPTDISGFAMAGEQVTLVDGPVNSWSLDKKHSNVTFNATYMGLAPIAGKFSSFEGTLQAGKADFSDAVIDFTVETKSIDTDDEGRDNHLRKDDFFNAEAFPQARFRSHSFKPLGDNKYEVKGDLTIRDVTKPVVFDVKYGGSVKDARGNIRAGFAAKTVIDRFEYGVKWDSKTPEGNFVVDKNVEIVLNIQLRQAAQQ
jgi:polyisoprenoid-binding protein YceI